MTWSIPPERSAGREPTESLRARRQAAAGTEQQPIAPGTLVREEVVGGVDCVVVRPPGDPRATMLYFHGGGYRLGTARSWTRFASTLAWSAGCEVVLPEYRLAPEHPFPAALHDAAAVFDGLSGRRLLLTAGDSAGGGLVSALVVAAIASGRRVPDGVVLLSPWVDLTVTSETFASRAGSDRLFPLEAAEEAAETYLAGTDPRDPLASPVYADLTGFPPVLLFAGGAETLLGDALRLTSRLTELGTSVEAHFPANMQHTWPALFPDLPESADAVASIGRFVDRISAA